MFNDHEKERAFEFYSSLKDFCSLIAKIAKIGNGYKIKSEYFLLYRSKNSNDSFWIVIAGSERVNIHS